LPLHEVYGTDAAFCKMYLRYFALKYILLQYGHCWFININAFDAEYIVSISDLLIFVERVFDLFQKGSKSSSYACVLEPKSIRLLWRSNS